MKKIDLENWERKSHYKWFSSFANPVIAFDVKMDVSNLLGVCKARKISSYAAIMYSVCATLNSIKSFRLRVLKDEVVEIDFANVAYTLLVDESTFINCRARSGKGFVGFLKDFNDNREKYAGSGFVQEEYNDISVVNDIYCSCVPWLNFSSVVQPVPDKIAESKSIPRVCWGKYFEENGRTFVTLNITANHALVDGLDMAKAFEGVQKAFDDAENFLKI